MRRSSKWLLASGSLLSLSLGIHAPTFAVGSAGCGFGSIIFSGNEGWRQLLAATTNNSTGSQTFGITSGTSNCSPGLLGAVQKQEDYMYANLSTLERETAQGRGDAVDGLASVMGCSNEMYGTFSTYTQANYDKIFNSKEPKIVLGNLRDSLIQNYSIVSQCSLVTI